MAPVRVKPVVKQATDMEIIAPKRVLTSKFKIYSDKEKASASVREATASNNSISIIKKKVTKDTKENSVKGLAAEPKRAEVHVGRKALADLSNVQRRSMANEVHKGAKLLNSRALRRRNSGASSSQFLVGKGKTSAVHGDDCSHASDRVSDSISTGSNSCTQKPKTQVCKAVKDRFIAKRSNQAARKSFPVSRQASYGDKRNDKEKAESACKDKRVYGFHVKTRVGGNVISQASDAKNKLLKDRNSDGFIAMGSKGQNNIDSRVRLRKSVKPIMRTGLTASKGGPPNLRCKAGLGKSQPTISSKRDIKGTSCLPKSIESIVHEKAVQKEVVSRVDKTLSPKILEISAPRKCDRRKSFTSMLISGSKLVRESSVSKQKLSCIDDQANPLEVAEYVDEIYFYYWAMEAQSTSLANYMTNQTEVTPQMRGVLINWLIEVHYKFDLMPETLYLSVSILDRYLSLVTIRKSQMQLVGLTALLLASKYEDFWHPRVKDLVSISAESYTTKQMLEMEKGILRELKFRFNLPTAYVFMLRFLKASQSDAKLEHLAFYLIELCLVEYEALSFKPSLLCAAAIYIARCTLHINPKWTALLEHHAQYKESQLRVCSAMILRFQKAAKNGQLNVTYEKYSRPELGEVAAIKPLKCLPS
ncbi:hypothetical protein V2J09_008361 [Rumex salicifolius]